MKQAIAAFAATIVLTLFGLSVLAQNTQAPPTPEQMQDQIEQVTFARNALENQVIVLNRQLRDVQAKLAECSKPAAKVDAKK